MQAMLEVDRGHFTTRDKYADSPQPIGYKATISAPHMVLQLHYVFLACSLGTFLDFMLLMSTVLLFLRVIEDVFNICFFA